MKMNKVVLFTLLTIACIVFLGQANADELTGHQIVEMTKIFEKVDDMSAELNMRIINKSGQERIREMTMVAKEDIKGVVSSLMRFLSPADVAGTGFLSTTDPNGPDEKHLYLPALGKPRRISSKERGRSFMGSDFSYEDISVNTEDYTYTLIGLEELNGEQVYKVESSPASNEVKKEVGFEKQIIWIRQANFTIAQVHYFDGSEQLLKVMESKNIIQLTENCWFATQLEMHNFANGSKTILIYKNIKTNSGISDEFFSIRQLTRGK